MHIIDTKLAQREQSGNLIQVGLLGAGEMALGLVNQIERYVPGMRVAAIYNRTQSKAYRCYEQAGIENSNVQLVDNGQDLDNAILSSSACVVSTPDCLWSAKDIDCIVEITGAINEAFEWIVAALKVGKKVCTFNAELDATVGPYLQKLARQNNTKYTLADGDQPGVTLNLVRYVKSMGFTPLVCGNIKGFLNNHRTPEDQKVFAEQYGLSLNMVTSFTDGTKVALEQASIANATGMQVAKRGMLTINHTGHIDELVNSYDIDQLKELGGIVEMVVGAKPGPGVFVFATTDDPLNHRFLKYVKMGEGPLYSFYQPYHLLFFEIPFSIARLVDFDDGTLDAQDDFKVEVIAMAKRDLKAGETLDGLGGYCHYGFCENASTVSEERLLPAGLADGKVLTRDVPKDQAISWDDVKCGCITPVEIAYHSIREPITAVEPTPKSSKRKHPCVSPVESPLESPRDVITTFPCEAECIPLPPDIRTS